jgi:hypothetical protein
VFVLIIMNMNPKRYKLVMPNKCGFRKSHGPMTSANKPQGVIPIVSTSHMIFYELGHGLKYFK